MAFCLYVIQPLVLYVAKKKTKTFGAQVASVKGHISSML